MRVAYVKPDVSLDWIQNKLKEDEETKTQFVNTILMLLEHGHTIKIGTDSYCLMLEANLDFDGELDYQLVNYEERKIIDGEEEEEEND